MDFEQFDFTMKPIKERWKNSFPNPVMQRIFQAVSDLELPAFYKVVNHFLDTFRMAPLPRDFRDAVRAEKNNSVGSRLDCLESINAANVNNLALTVQLELLGAKSLSEAVVKVRKMKPDERASWLKMAEDVSQMNPKEWEKNV